MNQASDQDLQLGKWIGGAALGALVMYMLDPDRGQVRRSRSGETLRELGRQTGDTLNLVTHRIGERIGEAGQAVRDKALSVTHGIEHAADSAPDSALRATAQGHDQAEKMSERGEQQGAARPDGAGTMQALAEPVRHAMAATGGRWTPGTRGAAMAGGTALGMASMFARSAPLAVLLGVTGLALFSRGASNRSLRGMLGATRGRTIRVEKSIRIDAEPDQVFDLWSHYENFPRFMSHVLDVRDLGNGRSHWVVNGPAGTEFEWDALLTEHTRPQRLAWRSEPGAEVEQSGSIDLSPTSDGTIATVRISYKPPAGVLGQAVARLFGRDPKRQLEEDLTRMKSLVERGVIPKGAARPATSDSKVLH
jgi:uncharacterized membrane protein